MKKVTKEQTLHGFEGFNAVSNEELEMVDGGKLDGEDAIDAVMSVVCVVASATAASAAAVPTPVSPALAAVSAAFAVGAIGNAAKILDQLSSTGAWYTAGISAPVE